MEGTTYQQNLTLESCDAAFSADAESSYTETASVSRPPIPEKWVQVSGRRYYSPELGRWANRDPIGEKGGLLLYGFVGNDGISRTDALGYRTSLTPRSIRTGRKAIKLLTQYRRLAEKRNICLSRRRLKSMDTKRDNGTISSDDLPAGLRREFPSEWRNWTLREIREILP